MMQELAERKGEPEFAEECKALYARQQELCRTLAWDGAWFRRCITDEGRFIGSESEPQAKIWLNTQSWQSSAASAHRSSRDRPWTA